MAGSSLLIGIVPVGNVSKIPMQDVMLGIQDVLITAAAHQGMPTHIRCGMVVDTPLPPPAIAWNDDKKKYNTDPFFNLAREIKDTTDRRLRITGSELFKALAVTNVELYSNTFNVSVYGEADINGCLAVVSTALLSKGARPLVLTERTIKECAHELGHTMGLRHCDDKRCVMSLSSDLYDVDNKTRYFCDSCAKSLNLE